jgi:hypothetical protein
MAAAAAALSSTSTFSLDDAPLLRRLSQRRLDDAFAPRHSLPSWLAMRLAAGAALLAAGAVGEADAAVSAALREASAGGDAVAYDRALLLQAAVATLVGDP